MLEVAKLYESVTGRRSGAAYNDSVGYKTGPFVRVFSTFLAPLGPTRTEEQLGELASRLFKKQGKFPLS